MKPGLSSPNAGAKARTKSRTAMLEQLEHAMRRSSAQGVIFGQAVASRAGISSSDMECMDFLNLEGRITAGRLADLTGLTTGAITGVVDRLEKAGLVRRERDAEDRRKVFIVTVAEEVANIAQYYAPLQRAMSKVWEGYSDAELKLLLRFFTQGYETMLSVTANLKGMTEEAPNGKRPAVRKPAAGS